MKKYYLLFLLLASSLFSLTISEILYETSASKYYNQVVEIYNNSSRTIKLTDYFFVSADRTNGIVLLSSNDQKDFASLNGVFTNEYLSPNEIAVIIDQGYRQGVPYDFKGSSIFTLTTTSLSSGRFLKQGEVLQLFDKHNALVDSWTLSPALPDESLMKIDLTRFGTKDNLYPSTPNLGVVTELKVTSDPPTHIAFNEVNASSQIIGIPQNYRFECQRDGIPTTSCNESIQLEPYETDKAKLYFYPNDNKNLVDYNDFIPLNGGASSPLTLWPLATGQVAFTYQKKKFPDATVTVNDFDSNLKDKLFINEIFYSTNKNLVWLEIYSSATVTTALEIYLWNSNFDLKKIITTPKRTYLAGSYEVFAYHNSDFNQEFSWYNNVIDTGEIIDITAEGVVALKNDSRYIDSVYYQKNWFVDDINGRSFQRKTTKGYAFTKDNFDLSLDKNMTPKAKNNFSRNIYFTAILEEKIVTQGQEHIEIALDYPINGELSIFIYDPDRVLMGRVFYIEELKKLLEPQKINLCLTKANLTTSGVYQLSFIYQTDYGDKKITKTFAYQN